MREGKRVGGVAGRLKRRLLIRLPPVERRRALQASRRDSMWREGGSRVCGEWTRDASENGMRWKQRRGGTASQGGRAVKVA